MTPARIRIRILQAQSNELHRIIEELKATKPPNMAELVAVCREVQDELKAAATALQGGRAAVATDQQSEGNA